MGSSELPIQDHDSSSFIERGFNSMDGSYTNGNTMGSSKIAVDPIALILTECITVTSAMRKHASWAHSSVSSILGGSSIPIGPSIQSSRPSTPRGDGLQKGHRSRTSSGLNDEGEDEGLAYRWGLRGKKGKSMQDNPLMAGFGRLRRELAGCKGRWPLVI